MSALQPQLLSTPPAPNPLLSTAPPPSLLQPVSQSQPMSRQSPYPESPLHSQPPRTATSTTTNQALSSISRLAASNGEITITTSHGPTSSHSMKNSPQNLSPNCNDSSEADLLIDSPSK